MGRLFSALVCCALLAAPSAIGSRVGGASGSPSSSSAAATWAKAEIRLVVKHGLMAKTVASFRPTDTLTKAELASLAAALTATPTTAAVTNPTARVTVAQLDTRLVGALGLSSAAKTFADGARAANLAAPARFGTETIARLLGLRVNHPAKNDDLELLPTQPVTRAETAYSVARILRFSGWEAPYVEAAASTFELPRPSAWQKRMLDTAVRFVGFPYVWGGTSEKPEAPFGVRAPGGFDCSGFVWRVYKLQAYPGGARLSATIKGRTTYQMSGEFPKAQRIPFAKLAPGDVVFFGPAGPRSSAASVGHAGIYLGGGWMIHASGQGVAVTPLTGWYRKQFAWGRRPLAEAGLAGVRP